MADRYLSGVPMRGALGMDDERHRLVIEDEIAEALTRLESDAERARRARLVRWQQGTGNERDGAGRSRQTPAARAQDARSAPGSHNSSPA